MNRTVSAAAVLFVALAGCTAAHPRAVTPPACPARKSPVRDSGGFRGMWTLVPGDPVIASSCAYAGGNDEPYDAGQLMHRAVLRGRIVRALRDDLNRMKPPKPGIYNCPMEDGAAHLLLFRYADGGVTRVGVADNGCRSATNGWRRVEAPADYPDRYGG